MFKWFRGQMWVAQHRSKAFLQNGHLQGLKMNAKPDKVHRKNSERTFENLWKYCFISLWKIAGQSAASETKHKEMRDGSRCLHITILCSHSLCSHLMGHCFVHVLLHIILDKQTFFSLTQLQICCRWACTNRWTYNLKSRKLPLS